MEMEMEYRVQRDEREREREKEDNNVPFPHWLPKVAASLHFECLSSSFFPLCLNCYFLLLLYLSSIRPAKKTSRGGSRLTMTACPNNGTVSFQRRRLLLLLLLLLLLFLLYKAIRQWQRWKKNTQIHKTTATKQKGSASFLLLLLFFFVTRPRPQHLKGCNEKAMIRSSRLKEGESSQIEQRDCTSEREREREQ